jgi:hypothetical protein
LDAADLVFLDLAWLSLAGAELAAGLPAFWLGFFGGPTRRLFTDPDAESFR